MGRVGAVRLTAAALALVSLATAAGGQTARPQRYVDPQNKFALSVPADAQVAERGDGIALSIHSRKGYLINLQLGAVNTALTLEQMAAKLESRYLWRQKTWSRKLGERFITVGELPAYDAHYEGGRTKARVVIARGRETDFVFMFFAPPRSFDSLVAEFDWVLGSFVPGSGEAGVAARQRPQPPSASAPPRAAAVKRFAEPEFGYVIEYPGNWLFAKPSPYTVIFSGKEGTDAFSATVSIQNVRPPGLAPERDDVATVLFVELKSQLADSATDVEYFGDRVFIYDRDGLRLLGREFVVTYSLKETRYRQWTVIVPRPARDVAVIWSYNAPEGRFDAFRPFAEAMLESWRISRQAR